MSEKPTGGPQVTTHASSGNGKKWLIGAAAAAVLAVGGYFAWSSSQDQANTTDIASNESAYSENAKTPDRAGPLALASSADDAAPHETSAASRETNTQRRSASRSSADVPEEVVGIIPVSASSDEGDAIVVQGARHPVWSRTPNARRLSNLYPERALARGREGEASVHCTVKENGALDCVRVSETTANAGFGNAALRVANMYRHSSQRWDGSSAVGSPVNLRVVFRMEDDNRRG